MTPPAYQASYDALARDVVARWREDGGNPFIATDEWREWEGATRALLREYVPAGSTVLDAGCGVNAILGEAPEYVRHGVDLSPEYAGIAAERGVAFVRSDLEALPYPDAMFDAVVATDVLEHVIDVNAVVRELLRVLRSGGVLIVRSPHNEDLAGYVNLTTYEFAHLRTWNDPAFRLLFGKVFGCEVVACPGVGSEIHAVVRKP